jgi:rubrerythrin
MSNIFHVSEVLDMGIEKEKKRRDFYGRVAEHFKEQEMRDLFTKLRDWEEIHVNKFTQIRDKIIEPETADSFPGELQQYMSALVDEKLYRDVAVESFAAKITSALAAIDYGLQFERDAILFFTELWRYVPEYSKKTVEELIDEERKHVVYLTVLRKKYE